MFLSNYIPMDPDAVAFLNAQGNSNAREKYALNRLVIDLKQFGIWSKCKAIYPFLGSTASMQKWNLKDPRDLNAAYRLTFFGGWTHSSTGATPNGVNAYANSWLNLLTAGAWNNIHLSYYSRTQSAGNSAGKVEIGAGANVAGTYGNLFLRLDTSDTFGSSMGSKSSLSTNNNSACFGIVSATNSTSLKVYKNNSLINNNTTAQTGTATAQNLTLGAQLYFGNPASLSDRQTAFCSIGDGLNDTEAANLYTAVQRFQTTLGRQV